MTRGDLKVVDLIPRWAKVTAGPKPPPGGIVSTFRVRVVLSVQARTKVPAEPPHCTLTTPRS